LARKTQATSEETTWPIAHQALNRVSRYWWSPGKNSRNSVPSTGKLPPTPNPINASITHSTVKLGAAPAAIPKMPPITRVQFQAIRRLGDVSLRLRLALALDD
jgi:hypothetical protein